MAKLKYYFPLDNYVKHKTVISDENPKAEENIEYQIKTRYSTVEIKTKGKLDSDFDEYKGSFIELIDQAAISISFNDAFNKTIENGEVLFNFFICFENSNSANFLQLIGENEPDILKIEKNANRISLVFNDKKIQNTQESGVRKNKWYNCTIYLKKDQLVDFYITDEKQLFIKDPVISTKINNSNFKLLFGENESGQKVKVADLSIFENVGQDEVIPTVNSLIENQLVLLSKSSMLENVDFNLFNDDENNGLVIQNEIKPIKFEFDLGDLKIIDYSSCKAILRVKEGFFKLPKNSTNDKSNEIIIENLTSEIGNKLSYTFKDLEIINVQELERVLFQLEIYNFTLVKEDNNFEEKFTKNSPFIIDKTFEIIDDRGENTCLFDVFVLGNDTLYNDGGDTKFTINLVVTNISGFNLNLNSGSGFKISSNFSSILKAETVQQRNLKILSYSDMKDIKSKQKDNDYLYLEELYNLDNNNSLIIQLSNIVAEKANSQIPSGSYPFYLEYKNIPGYRNGKVKFFIKTGKIFYS